MYEQTLLKIIEPIKKTTLTRLNRGKKWKYGYDKDHDIVVLSKTGVIGEIYDIQGFKIALPKAPQKFKSKTKKWGKVDLPKELKNIKTIFDWRVYPDEHKEKWYGYIDEAVSYTHLTLPTNREV